MDINSSTSEYKVKRQKPFQKKNNHLSKKENNKWHEDTMGCRGFDKCSVRAKLVLKVALEGK